MFAIEKKNGERISNVRNFAYAIRIDGETPTIYGLASNTAGSSWSSIYWNKVNNATLLPIVKNGTEYTVYPARVTSGAKLYAGETYEWFAI